MTPPGPPPRAVSVLRLGVPGMALVFFATPALAHGGAAVHGWTSGFLHPLFGPDHVAAMIAVGLWGALLGPPALWALPIAFPLMMAAGGAGGILGLSLPFVEAGIAASAAALGLAVAIAARPPLALAIILVGIFAVFHGHAHGTELPNDADALAFAAGFVVATGLLHLAGIALGLLSRWPGGRLAVRVAGGAIAVAGLVFLGRLA